MVDLPPSLPSLILFALLSKALQIDFDLDSALSTNFDLDSALSTRVLCGSVKQWFSTGTALPVTLRSIWEHTEYFQVSQWWQEGVGLLLAFSGWGPGMLNHPAVSRLYMEELSSQEPEKHLLGNLVRGNNVGIGIRTTWIQTSALFSKTVSVR